MSPTTLTTMLLLSYLSAGGTSLAVADPTQLVISEVRWLFDEGTTTVRICTVSDLPDGTPKLVYDDPVNDIMNFEGKIDVDIKNCATFSSEDSYTLTDGSARYELFITSNPLEKNVLGRGVTTFAITVRTTLLTCGELPLTKITWSDTGTETLPEAITCLDSSSDFGKVCYHNEDLSRIEFCFEVTDENDNLVIVCLTGPADATPPFDGVKLSANYFQYGHPATLSLDSGTLVYDQLRAIVRSVDDSGTPGTPSVHDCPEGECSFIGYEPKYAKYEVCADAIQGEATLQTSTTTFTDMNLYAFDGGLQKSMLLEFVFANGMGDMKYKAGLSQSPPAGGVAGIDLGTVNVDCTSVSVGHACFGFLDTGAGTDTVYLALSDMDDTNTIIAPFDTTVITGLHRE